jgi:hypothetical protein
MYAMCVTTELELPETCFSNVQLTGTKLRLSLGIIFSGMILHM